MGKHRKGKAQKRNKVVDTSETPELINAPHSFVIHRGLPFPNLTYLTLDFRRMMEPYTASSLRERRKNKIKDFVSLSAMFHVSHMCIFNKTANRLSFKVARLPKGPTLTFKVHQFTLSRDVLASAKKQYINDTFFKHAPLVILNNFSGEGNHLKLMANTLQNMFPTINLASVNLSTVKRCVLFSYNPVTKLIDMRHFSVTVTPVGLNKAVKKVIVGKVPNLARCEDIADFVTNNGALSDSEYEDDEGNEVVLPQTLKSRGNLENNKSAIRLHEVGPRLTIELTKIQDDLFKGDVLYHNSIIKSEEELAELKKKLAEKKRLKELRKKVQAENVQRKLAEKDDHKARSLAGTARKFKKDDGGVEEAVDDDAEYYREELGEEPDEDLFNTDLTNRGGRKRAYVPKYMQQGSKDAKRRKFDDKGKDKPKKDGFKPRDKSKGGFKAKKSDNNESKFDKSGKGGKGGKGKKFKDGDAGAATKNAPKKIKPKKKGGKKKPHRNKNK